MVLSVPLSGTWIDIRLTLTDLAPRRRRAGGTVEDASTAMRSVLAIAAGADGPDAMPDGRERHSTRHRLWNPEEVADHTGVTATFGAPLGADADGGARRAGGPLLARGVRGHRLGGHR